MPKLKFFDWLFKRKLSFCVLPINATMKTKDMREVHHVQILMLTFFTQKNVLENIFQHLGLISIPKVAKNGLKVPKMAKSDNTVIRPTFCISTGNCSMD